MHMDESYTRKNLLVLAGVQHIDFDKSCIFLFTKSSERQNMWNKTHERFKHMNETAVRNRLENTCRRTRGLPKDMCLHVSRVSSFSISHLLLPTHLTQRCVSMRYMSAA